MNPAAIQVAIDILRELGHEDIARWVEHPEAVRALLRDPPADRNGECPGPAAYETISGFHVGSCGGSEYHYHMRGCPIVAAWLAIGDPRAVVDVENAHEEALTEHTNPRRR